MPLPGTPSMTTCAFAGLSSSAKRSPTFLWVISLLKYWIAALSAGSQPLPGSDPLIATRSSFPFTTLLGQG
jgi:hypothetical protein